MQTLFIIEYQSIDTHTIMIVNSEGEVWHDYKQTLRHGQAK